MVGSVSDEVLEALLKQEPDYYFCLWANEECYRFYVEQRRMNCEFTELMDLWLLAPYCVECKQNDPFYWGGLPEISPSTWKEDLAWKVGQPKLRETTKELRINPGYAFLCHRCGKELRPWEDDELYVERFHLEEQYSIPMETPGKRQPSKRLRNRIIELYDFKCFGCSRRRKSLHIDHVMPQSHGETLPFEISNRSAKGADKRRVTVFQPRPPYTVTCILGRTHPTHTKGYFGRFLVSITLNRR